MSALIYGHDKRYAPKYKNELAKTLAKRLVKEALEYPKYEGKTEFEILKSLTNWYERNFNMHQLYNFYFNPDKMPKPKPSKLERDVERAEAQLSLL